MATAQGGPLFTDPPVASIPTGNPGEVVLRARTVRVDLTQLRNLDGSPVPAGTLLTFNPFPGQSLTVQIDQVTRHRSGGFTLTGTVAGKAQSRVFFTVHEDTVMAHLDMPGVLCELRPLGGGDYGMFDLDPAGYPEDGEPVVPDLPVVANDLPGIAADDGSLLDVLVVYTTAARQGAGSAGAMDTLIDLAESQTNASYATSGITPRIRVVHREEVAYSESGFSFSGALSDLRAGNVPNALALRDQYGADLVVMIVEGDSSLCGIAYLMSTVSSSFAGSAVSVTKRSCATANLTFGHEIGHNLGARHQREADSSDGPFTFNHGYADAANNFRTIMGIAIGSCSSCTRIAYWSNPDVSFNGNPTGIAEGDANAADNRKTLNQTAATAAAFRDTVIPVAGDYAPVASVVAPYWQTGTGFYTFVALTHPSLSGMDPQIGVRAQALLNGGGRFGTATDFTIVAGATQRLFVVRSDHPTLNATNIPDAVFISGASGSDGYLRFDPVASDPSSLTVNGGYRDVTMLSLWGAVVIENGNTGFALEFIGDAADSRGHPGQTAGVLSSGVR